MRAHKLLMVLVLAACGGRTITAPRLPQPVAIDIGAVLAKLTMRQKVAQLVVPWLGGNYMALDDSAFQIATRWVDTLEVGGIIISVGSPYDIAAKLNTLQANEPLDALIPIFERDEVAIVLDGREFLGLITRVDLINHLRRS